ncbi:histidinol-phosphate aminotransferase [Sphaeroforma arctica JP610]|uniref:histidinol-phosphate transaminase n=1 Tax=Sphaeroforma arctica JP610 TaxID=667725 RepID=A0A0L0FHM3_9EUKA|nr:histidinol-phosphate aminotransferase [Sphaeroforma arctica JP610]KNC75533.1 histidinol-phosphate aminotransferase [Sphaeroforma arctica JP610]|eukprot:XP_014149435.1 histidinol-phosphate aminotransferase [Sphaeroforma arctica JP610]
MTFDLRSLLRPNVRDLKPYRCARDDYDTGILLDANENSFGAPMKTEVPELNRYPDPHQSELRSLIADFRGVQSENVFVGVGSDEAIDLLMRVIGTPGTDKLMTTPPTYGMYKVCANINDLQVVSAPLTPTFELRVDEMLAAVTPEVKLIFVCSPGNPTAVCCKRENIIKLLKAYTTGLVVVDEAYIDFAKDQKSCCDLLADYPNLVVLQTLSKSFGLAGIRLGMLFGSEEIVSTLNKVKAPYNVNKLTSKVAIEGMKNIDQMKAHVRATLEQRDVVTAALQQMETVRKIHPTDANFLLVQIDHSLEVYKRMADRGVVIRYRGDQTHCDDCVRITIGTADENEKMLSLLREIAAELS